MFNRHSTLLQSGNGIITFITDTIHDINSSANASNGGGRGGTLPNYGSPCVSYNSGYGEGYEAGFGSR